MSRPSKQDTEKMDILIEYKQQIFNLSDMKSIGREEGTKPNPAYDATLKQEDQEDTPPVIPVTMILLHLSHTTLLFEEDEEENVLNALRELIRMNQKWIGALRIN